MSDNADRDNNGQFMLTLDGAERDAKAVRMKARGATYQQISDELEYGGRGNAYRAVQRALAEIPAEGVDELRRIQSEQLDYLTDRALKVLEGTHYAHSTHGELLYGPNGEVLHDSAPVLNAIDRLVRILERRAKLMGLDAPLRHEVITLDYLDQQIRAASAELARAAAAEAEAAEGA